MYRHIAKIVQLESNDQCYSQNCAVMNHVIKRPICMPMEIFLIDQEFSILEEMYYSSINGM